jgi:hypothetical protein
VIRYHIHRPSPQERGGIFSLTETLSLWRLEKNSEKSAFDSHHYHVSGQHWLQESLQVCELEVALSFVHTTLDALELV